MNLDFNHNLSLFAVPGDKYKTREGIIVEIISMSFDKDRNCLLIVYETEGQDFECSYDLWFTLAREYELIEKRTEYRTLSSDLVYLFSTFFKEAGKIIWQLTMKRPFAEREVNQKHSGFFINIAKILSAFGAGGYLDDPKN